MATFIKPISLIALLFAMISPIHADGISAAEKVYQNVNNSIFMIFETNKSDPNKVVSYGSGVAVSKNIIATNCHVALKADTSFVKIQKKFQPATLIYKDEADDICLLKIPENTLIAVSFRSANSVKIGEEVYTIGSPRGYEKSISRGIISNKIKFKNTAILQTDASISPGSSGGGLFDTKSHLIGMTFLKNESTGAEGIGFAVPAEIIKDLVIKAKTIHPLNT
jgi:serine protease Do